MWSVLRISGFISMGAVFKESIEKSVLNFLYLKVVHATKTG
jgi:hypothetical protein